MNEIALGSPVQMGSLFCGGSCQIDDLRLDDDSVLANSLEIFIVGGGDNPQNPLRPNVLGPWDLNSHATILINVKDVHAVREAINVWGVLRVIFGSRNGVFQSIAICLLDVAELAYGKSLRVLLDSNVVNSIIEHGGASLYWSIESDRLSNPQIVPMQRVNIVKGANRNTAETIWPPPTISGESNGQLSLIHVPPPGAKIEIPKFASMKLMVKDRVTFMLLVKWPNGYWPAWEYARVVESNGQQIQVEIRKDVLLRYVDKQVVLYYQVVSPNGSGAQSSSRFFKILT